MRGPRVLLAMLGLALGLGIGELGARLTGPWLCVDTPGVFLESDPVLGWRQRPNLAGWAAYCSGKPVPPTLLETDARGFRNPGRPIAKPAGTARILLLGGNVPQALGVPWPFSMAGMLEGRADARAGKVLEVVNGAMGSFGLDQDLLLLRAEGQHVAPDLVLVVIDSAVETIAISPALIRQAGSRVPAKPYFDVSDGALVPLPVPPAETPPRPPVATSPLHASALHRWLRREPPSVGEPQAWLPIEADAALVDPEAEQQRTDRVFRAILTAMRQEAASLGAKFGVVLAPPPRRPRWGERTPDIRLAELMRELGIPAASLAMGFWAMPTLLPNDGYIPETTRFNADGHFLASQMIWNFLEREHLLPEGVVTARVLGGGRIAPLEPFPDAPLAWLRMQRTGWVARLVVAGLLGVAIVWLASPMPARLRDGVTLATSLGSVAFFLGLAPAVAALAFALLVYGVLEIRPAWIRQPLMALLAVALLVVPLRWLFGFPTETAVVVRPYVAFAGATAMLRLGRYARERRQADQRTPLMRYLVGMLFFPTFSTGPVQSVDELAASGATAVAPATVAALGRHLVQAGSGALRVAWGAAKILIAVAYLNLITPEVLATSGAAVGRARLWAWVVENTIYLWALFSGLSDIGAGLARMVGVRVPENFRAPWRAAHPAELWERVLATVTSSIDETVGRPIERRFGAPAGVFARFAVAALWYAWIVVALLGVFGIPPSAWLGLAAWAGVFTAAWLVLPRTEAHRPLGWTATHLLLALSSIPLIAFPRAHFQVFFGIAARLVGLR
jgi:hypothetical protein